MLTDLERRYVGPILRYRLVCALLGHLWLRINTKTYGGPFAVSCVRCGGHRESVPTRGTVI